MAFNDELLQGEVHAEPTALQITVLEIFQEASRMGCERMKRDVAAHMSFGSHVMKPRDRTERNKKEWSEVKKDPVKYEKRKAQKRDCMRRRSARERGLASVVMSDGTVWTNPDVVKQ